MRGHMCLLFNYTYESEHRLAPTTSTPVTAMQSFTAHRMKSSEANHKLRVCQLHAMIMERLELLHLPPSLLLCGLAILKLDLITL